MIAAAIVLYRIIASAGDSTWSHRVGLVAALIVGVVLLSAGAAKVANRQLWVSDARNLGVPNIVTTVVPIIELALGSLSIVGIGWPFVPVGVALMLGVFAVFIAFQLGAGQQPNCACFGAWSDRPMSRFDIWRNATLMSVALLSLLR